MVRQRQSHIFNLVFQVAFTCLLLLAPLYGHSLICAKAHSSSETSHAQSIAVANQVIDIIQSGYPVQEWAGKSGIMLNPEFATSSILPEVVRVLEQFPSLKEAQKQELIALVRAKPAQQLGEIQLRQLILLGLHDRTMWITFVAKFNLDPVGAHWLSYFLPVFAQNMPDSLKHEVLTKIGRSYFQLGKDAPFGQQGAKRTADYFFKVILRADQLIESEIAKGQTARQAFESYLYKVESFIPNEDRLTSKEIFGMFRLVQQSLQEQSASLSSRDGQAPVLHIYGSVPNGRAKKMSSDLDAVIVHANTNKNLETQIDSALREFIQNTSPGSVFSFGLTANIPNIGAALHPVIIRISLDQIEMLIFSPYSLKTYRPYRLE